MNALQNQSDVVAPFEITNTGTVATTFSLSCAATGQVTCGRIANSAGTTITTLFLDAGEVADINAHFATGATGTGTLTLTASGSATDAGSFNLTVTVPPTPHAVTASLINHNRAGIDRGLCFTTGAGPAAGSSCGDLFITHAMPAYRTMGKDRTLTLLYNSAAASGQLLVAAAVTQPVGSITPNKLTAVLRVNGATDSADYSPVAAGATAQVVMGARLAANIPTGVYVDTLLLRNTYAGSILDAVLVDTAVVVNQLLSEYGQGWGVVGVERLLFSQPTGTRGILWVGGDGSALRYDSVAPNIWAARAVDFRDTITYRADSAWYTRRLRHGVQVIYDAFGRQIRTINRYAQVTKFVYDTVAGGGSSAIRLGKIQVPGNDAVVRQYRFYWSAAPDFLLDSIADPGGRKLKLARDCCVPYWERSIVTITDPDGQQTRFNYQSVDAIMAARGVPNPAVPGGWAWTGYTLSGRGKLTRSRSPAGPTGADSTVITYKPWQVNGLDTVVSGLWAPAIPTTPVFGFPSTVDGPIAGTGDRASVWANQFGQPTRMLLEGTGAVTEIYRDSTTMPALTTRMKMPDGRWIALQYNSRANLVMQRDNTTNLDGLPTEVLTWAYGNASFPDTPTRVADGLGRASTYTLHATLGVPILVTDPAGHSTSYAYFSNGLLQSVSENSVQTWIQAAGTDSVKTLTTTFAYDGMGQVNKTTLPSGAVIVGQTDATGDVAAQWGADGLRASYYHDRLGRDTLTVQETIPSANPLGATSSCRTAEYTCGFASTPWPSTAPTMHVRTYYGPVGVDSVVTDRGVPRSFRYDGGRNESREMDEDTTYSIRRYVGGSLLLDSTVSRTGAKVTYHYDVAGRLILRSFGKVITNASDITFVAGTMDTIPGDSISYQYDISGHLLVATGTWGHTGTVSRTYWANGLLKSKVVTQPFPDSLYYWYDASGALVKRAHTSNTPGGATSQMRDTTYFAYDATTGRLASMTTNVVYPTGVPSQTLQFQWDALGRRRTVTYPGGKAVQYRYDATGTLRAVWTEAASCDAAGGNFCVQLARDSVDILGHTLSEVLTCGGSPHDGYSCGGPSPLRRASRYYSNGWLASQQAGSTRDSVQYDVTGNISRRWADADQRWHDLYYAASTNRLVLDSLEHPSSITISPELYYYTGDGSRRNEGLATPQVQQLSFYRVYKYDGLGRIRGFGSIQTDEQNSFANNYDDASCRYDAEGAMIRACASGAFVAYDGDNVIAASDYQWHFVQGPGTDDPLVGFGQTANGSVYILYWVSDGQGGTLSTSLADGTWNPALNSSSADNKGWQQSGGVRGGDTYSPERQGNDNAPKLSFFRNRVYDAQSGQWTQEDPMGLAGGLNLYQFSSGDPTSFSDPFGLKVCFGKYHRHELVIAVEDAIDGHFELDAAGCASVATPNDPKHVSPLLQRFNEMVSSPNVYLLTEDAGDAPDCTGLDNATSYSCSYKHVSVVNPYLDVGKNNPRSYPGCWLFGATFGTMTESLPMIVAHELLGHGYTGRNGDTFSQQRDAIRQENLVKDRHGQPPRCVSGLQ